MKATVRDPDVLRAIQPLDVIAYLRATGWSKVDSDSGRYAVWSYPNPNTGQELDALLPLSATFRDYPLRVSQLLNTLEDVEARSQTEIVRDLLTSQSDIVRFDVDTDDSGTISLDDGVRIVSQVQNAMLAAACATVEPRAYYHARKPPDAIDYLRNVRLGQTEQGSYVVTVLSRVPPEMQQRQQQLFSNEGVTQEDDPFARRVTRTLARALVETRSAAEEAMMSGRFDAFQDAVKLGVNANLCAALAQMNDPDHPHRIEIAFSWSRTRPVRTDTPRRVVFEPDFFAIVGEAARLFQERTPREDFEIRGFVVKLDRRSQESPGTATVGATIDGHPRKVQVLLNDADYGEAVKAHREWNPVVCNGELVRTGRMLELRNARGFRVEADDDED